MKLSYNRRFVQALAPKTPSTTVPTRISFKNVLKCTVQIAVANATTVTGSAITLKQSTDVSGTSEKALSFKTMLANTDTAASDIPVETAVTSDTFTTTATNSKNALYLIEVSPDDLDTNNGFDCFRVGTGDGTATVVGVTYILDLRDGALQTASVLTN